MNETTNLNNELLTADAHGRKHIPFAVFAVIVVHIVLFLILLIAAGCRAKARAKHNTSPVLQATSERPAIMPAAVDSRLISAPAAISTNVLPAAASAPAPLPTQPVMVTEPPAERPSTSIRKAAKAAPKATDRPTASHTQRAKIYVVKAGDTVEKIARLHRTSVQAIKSENNLKNQALKPGQQLRVSAQKPKTSNEV